MAGGANVRGLDSLARKLRDLKVSGEQLRQVAEAGLTPIITEAKAHIANTSYHPYATGNLSNDLRIESAATGKAEAEARGGTNLEYAIVEEFRHGHSYLRSSILGQREEARQAAIDAAEELVG